MRATSTVRQPCSILFALTDWKQFQLFYFLAKFTINFFVISLLIEKVVHTTRSCQAD